MQPRGPAWLQRPNPPASLSGCLAAVRTQRTKTAEASSEAPPPGQSRCSFLRRDLSECELATTTLARLPMKHSILISRNSTPQGRPLITAMWAVGYSLPHTPSPKNNASQSFLMHVQGTGTKTKGFPLTRTKLVNGVISCIFVISSQFGNQTCWKNRMRRFAYEQRTLDAFLLHACATTDFLTYGNNRKIASRHERKPNKLCVLARIPAAR